MDIKIVFLLVHLIGFALGLGGATASDITFLNAANERKISPARVNILSLLSKIIWVGLILLILSGIGFLILSNVRTGHVAALASAKFQVKLALVAIATINGFVFAKKVFPFLRSQDAQAGRLSPKINLLAATGSISIVSWYSILILSILPRGLTYPVYFYFGIYLVILAGAIFVSHTMLKKKFA